MTHRGAARRPRFPVRVLGIETSGPVCRVAVLVVKTPPRSPLAALAGGAAVEREGAGGFGRHSDVVHGLLDGVLRGARTRVADLDGIAASIGPGSFTGLRVGLAVAKALAVFRGIPLAGIPTLEAVAVEAFAAGAASPVVSQLEAGRGDLYAAVYGLADGRARRIGGPWVASRERVAGLASPGAIRADLPPRASTVAALGAVRLLAGARDDPRRIVPLYLRRPQAVELRLRTAGRRRTGR